MLKPSGLSPFLGEFWRFDRRATLHALVLNLMAALLEGLGLMLLLPLLNLAGVFGPGGGAPQPLSLSPMLTVWLGRVAPNHRLLLILAVFVGLIAMQSAVTLLREQKSQQLQLRFVDYLRDTLFGGLARSRWGFISGHHSSEFLSVLTMDVQRVGLGVVYLLQLFTQFAVFPVYVGVAFHLSPLVTGLALVTGGGLWLLLRKSRNVAKQGGLELSRANQRLFNDIQEFLGALKLIKIHGEEVGYQRQFGHVVAHLRDRQIEFNTVRSRSQMAYRIGGALALATLSYSSISLVHLPAASLLVLIAVFSRMLPQVSQIHMGLQQLWLMVPAFENWRRWMEACVAECEEVRHATLPVPLRDGIHFQNVSYRHPKGSQYFQVPELFIPARRTTAIIGPTGSGKTTFLDLLSGLNTPDAGAILVDGLPLLAQACWRQRIAYVPQDTAILDGTIRENLTWGAADSDDGQMMSALDQLAAGNFVRRLPDGLDTWVGERGVRLSGGEKQRLALARALLRQPELLILDEATSALDREHQQIILEALRGVHGRMTVLIVTHRYEEICDLLDGVVRIDSGYVGTWEPLTSKVTLDVSS